MVTPGNRPIYPIRGRPPDERAIKWLNSFLGQLLRVASRQVGVWSGMEDVNLDEDDWRLFGRSESTVRLYEENDLSYENEQEPNDGLQEVREIYEEAVHYLNGQEYEDLIDSIHALLAHIGNKDIPLGDAERWIDILQKDHRPIRSPSDDPPNLFQVISAAIRRLSIELIAIIARHPKALAGIEWRQLEHVVATALEGIGFDVALTPPSKDGGKDVIASITLEGTKNVYFIEIKHWRSGKRVSSSPIMDFVEVNVAERTAGGLFISTSGYDGSVCSCFTELRRKKIGLGDSGKVVSLCSQYTRSASGLWSPSQDLPALLLEHSTIRLV